MVALGPAAGNVITVCCAAARGTATRSGRVRRSATGTTETSAAIPGVFVSPRTFNLFLFTLSLFSISEQSSLIVVLLDEIRQNSYPVSFKEGVAKCTDSPLFSKEGAGEI